MVDFFIQFQNKRVGSTFLQNAINSHPDLVGIDEVFINIARKTEIRKSGFVPYIISDASHPEEYIEYVIKKTHWDKKAISMKLMYNQITYHSGLLQYIRFNKIPIIHLQRRNLAKQIISFLNQAIYNDDPIQISGDDLLSMVEEADRLNKYWKNQLSENIRLTLFYEDIIGETTEHKTYLANNANIAVCDFFKVKQYQLFANTKKKNNDDLSIYLPNIEEIKKVFKGTKYEWMMN